MALNTLKCNHLTPLPFKGLIARLISWNLTTRCLAVTGGGSVGECGRLRQSSWFFLAAR